MALEARVRLTLGVLHLDVALTVPEAGIVAVLGPNGAGKTTVLRALAGLVPLDRGSRVALDGEVLDEPAAGVLVPTEARAIGFVFQDHLLFPHLSALDNVAFGLRRRGMGRPEARRAARGWLTAVGLGAHTGARPHALSGGQAQRVALARALAVRPRLLLLDEPLSALDAGARASFRAELRRHLSSFAGSRVVVTHDLVEAVTLADHLVVVEAGQVVQQGSAAELSRRPRSDYVAQLVGLNLLRGQARHGTVTLASGGALHSGADVSGDAYAAVAPRAVALSVEPPARPAANIWQARVASLDSHGDRVLARLDGPVPVVAEVPPASVAAVALREGDPVWAALEAADVDVYPVEWRVPRRRVDQGG